MKKIQSIILFATFAILSANAQQKMTVNVPESGQLKAQFTEEESRNVTHLTITGSINAIDFKAMRDEFEKLEFLDLTNARIKLYIGKKGTYPEKSYVYPMDCIPAYGFKDKKTLKHIILSPYIKNLEDCAFLGCDNLRICEIKKKKAPNLLPKALNDSVTTVFVPLGSRDAYWGNAKWKPFNLVEGDFLARKINITEPGSLDKEIRKIGSRLEDVNILQVSGELNSVDFKNIRDNMPKLVDIDMTGIDNHEIPEYTFAQKNFLMWVSFPHSLHKIGSRAFSSCVRLIGNIKLPDTTTEVSGDAFLGCQRVSAVILKEENILNK